MMSRAYPIWNKISSCAYKSSNKSYGVRAHNEIEMLVGSGKNHSELMATIKQTRKEYGDWSSFHLYVDDKLVRAMYYNKRTKEFRKRKPKHLI